MTRRSEGDADLRRWARGRLGLGEGEAPADRAALLRRLADEAFVPPPDVSSVWVFEGKLAGGFGLIAIMGRLCFQRFRPAERTA